MPDTIEGYVLGQTVPMRVGDKVGLLETGDDYSDTFAGQEVEIINILESGQIGVRTHNAIALIVGRLQVAPALPKKRGGRKPVKRAAGEQIIRMSISLPESDVKYLREFNPRNLSDAIRKLINNERNDHE